VSAACTGTPISWLRLERYHAGEADGAERRAIDEHVAGCEACARCLRHVRDDDAGRALPPLPVAAGPGRRVGRPVALLAARRAGALGAALAAAAAVALAWGRRDGAAPADPAPGGRAKGDEVGLALVREGGDAVADEGGSYSDGERFKALVTCPPAMRAGWDLVVYERREASFPLAPRAELACGNGVPLPGAFQLTGREPLTVCLAWGERGGEVDRAELRASGPGRLARAVCRTLAPAP
jgi:hypothetical protein